jgi:hypothetical protein
MEKWVVICIVGVMAVLFTPLGVMEYGKSQCRITAINAQMPADEILKLCK